MVLRDADFSLSADSMTDASVQIFAVALAAAWCGFGLYGLARMAARSPQGREMLERLRRSGPLAEAAALAMLVTVVAIGGTKPGDGNGGGLRAGNPVLPAPPPEPAFGLVEVRTEGVALRAEPTNSVDVAAWRLRGASEDGIWIESERPFFALGTNPVRRVYASASGALSFESARHPPPGAALPQRLGGDASPHLETGLPQRLGGDASPHLETGLAQRLGGDASPHLETALAPFRAPLGILPAANETNAAPSRFWHAPAPGGGLIVAWENVLVDRLPGRRATIQAELKPNGDFRFLYDFPDPLDPPATNFVVGAQAGTNAVNALAILGTNLLAETVWRVDGARVTNGVSVAGLLCTNGALRTPARFALEWKNTSGLDPNADSDGDGLPDWDEVFRHGTDPRRIDTDGDSLSDSSEVLAGANPLDADENNDGVPDGVDPVAWAADPIWADNATNGGTSITITLNAAIPADASASLVVGDLCIPLRSPGSWTLALVPGELYAYRLHTSGAEADLSIAPATNAPPQRSGPPLRSVPAPFPFWTDDPDGVFDGPSGGGSGEMAVPTLELAWIDPGDGSHEDGGSVGLHEENAATFQYTIYPSTINRIPNLVQTTGFNRTANALYLPLGPNGESVSGTIGLNPDRLRWGSVSESRGAHRCSASPENPYCVDCGHYIPVDICLSVSQNLLTLKHNDQVFFSIVHAHSSGETHTNGTIEIRYKNGDGEWWILGDESELRPWTARFPGRFEARGKIVSGDREWTTPVLDLTVLFPSVDDIRLDPDVIQRAGLEWRATLDDCSTNWGLSRERGYWIALDTQTSLYAAINPTNGDWAAENEIDAVNLGARPPDFWSDPSDHQAGAVFVVASFHTHPPTAAWTAGGEPGRPVGPSEDGDVPATAAWQVPGLVFDYEPDPAFSANMHTNGIPAGWPTNAPARIYPVTPPERRPLP